MGLCGLNCSSVGVWRQLFNQIYTAVQSACLYRRRLYERCFMYASVSAIYDQRVHRTALGLIRQPLREADE